MKKDEASQQADDDIDKRVNQALDTSIENLTPDVRRRLNQARLATADSTHRPFTPVLRWAGAVSIALAVFVIVSIDNKPEQISIEPFAEVLQEDPEMLEELEFVYWMTEEQQLAES